MVELSSHRIREAMRPAEFSPMGGEGQVIKADETFFGSPEGEGGRKSTRRRPSQREGRYAHKNVVFTFVERGGEGHQN
jgi:hypothetical protein